MYPHNGKVMTKPKTLPIKLLDINEFLSSKGTQRAIMACKAGKVTPSNIPWKTLRTIKAQTFHLATTGLKTKKYIKKRRLKGGNKGQLIMKANFEVFIWTKKWTKMF